MNAIITRFAPSPTGNLHIGSIRTALINYIITQQAKKINNDSKFLLRIEDTDKKRSSLNFNQNIIDGLKWLEIDHDDEIYLQSLNIKKHQEIAIQLLANNKAYKCICSKEVLEEKRKENLEKKISLKKLCQICENDKNIQSLESGFTVRIKIPENGITKIHDEIQGEVKVSNEEIDNFILLREDGTPTYMLSVVVDDYSMGVNFVIRGDDHLNNVFRQIYIYKNMNWPIPRYAHIPLIHGEDGKKLSKRHGAVNFNELKTLGYLKESIINNLILLGWSPPDSNEIIIIKKIIDYFNINKLSKSSSIFNYDKLNFLNNYYIKNNEKFDNLLEYSINNLELNKFLNEDIEKYKRIFLVYKKDLKIYKDLENICSIYYNKIEINKDRNYLDNKIKLIISEFVKILEEVKNWDNDNLETIIKEYIIHKKIKFVFFGKPMRLILIKTQNGPSISDILFILGKKDSIHRIKNYINT